MDSEQVTPITARAAAAPDQAALYAARLNGVVAAGHALIEDGQAISLEMLAFWQGHLKEGLAAGQRLLACDCAQSALDVQLDYAKAAFQAYVDQCARIGDRLSRSVSRIYAPAEREAPEPTSLAA